MVDLSNYTRSIPLSLHSGLQESSLDGKKKKKKCLKKATHFKLKKKKCQLAEQVETPTATTTHRRKVI